MAATVKTVIFCWSQKRFIKANECETFVACARAFGNNVYSLFQNGLMLSTAGSGTQETWLLPRSVREVLLCNYKEKIIVIDRRGPHSAQGSLLIANLLRTAKWLRSRGLINGQFLGRVCSDNNKWFAAMTERDCLPYASVRREWGHFRLHTPACHYSSATQVSALACKFVAILAEIASNNQPSVGIHSMVWIESCLSQAQGRHINAKRCRKECIVIWLLRSLISTFRCWR